MLGTVVDADAHINETPLGWAWLHERWPGWLSAAESGGRTVAGIDGRAYPLQEGRGRGVPIDSALHPACRSGAFDLDGRIADMDSEGIDIQVLYGGLSLGVTGFSDPGFAADFAQQYNDWLLDEVGAAHPDRLVGVCTVPLQDPARALTELHRVAAKGAYALTIPPMVGERNLDDRALDEFFAAAADADLALGVHSAPGMHLPLPGADRFANYAQVHLLSFPIDQMVAFTALALGGVLDRHPGLRVAFLEAGVGWVPYLVDRAHEHQEKRAELLPDMRSTPRELIERGQCYFSFECEDPFLTHYVEQFGSAGVLFASDYPHWDAEWPGCVESARALAEPLGDAAVAAVMGENARRFYALDGGAASGAGAVDSVSDSRVNTASEQGLGSAP
ncbi:MAG TPA: amidohydrolase family protein [Acidimicrobiales bacterium]